MKEVHSGVGLFFKGRGGEGEGEGGGRESESGCSEGRGGRREGGCREGAGGSVEGEGCASVNMAAQPTVREHRARPQGVKSLDDNPGCGGVLRNSVEGGGVLLASAVLSPCSCCRGTWVRAAVSGGESTGLDSSSVADFF